MKGVIFIVSSEQKQPQIYSFYNNKGGVGKTTLCQNIVCEYATLHPKTEVLVIDMCPQANVSQFLLGGGSVGYNNNQRLQSTATRRNIVGFIDWLLQGNINFTQRPQSFKVSPRTYNQNIPSNISLIAGDSFLEAYGLALNYATINPANIHAWRNIMLAIRRLCSNELQHHLREDYTDMTVFIDCNPSFSIYTQMALLSSDNLIVPMMADFSSIEGIKGIMMLLYGEYATSALRTYAENIITFNSQVQRNNLTLPKLYKFIFNNYTSNQGIAKAYNSIKNELVDFCFRQYQNFPQFFSSSSIPTKSSWEISYICCVKDFHSAGKVSSTLGLPITSVSSGTYTLPDGTDVLLTRDSLTRPQADIRNLGPHF